MIVALLWKTVTTFCDCSSFVFSFARFHLCRLI